MNSETYAIKEWAPIDHSLFDIEIIVIKEPRDFLKKAINR